MRTVIRGLCAAFLALGALRCAAAQSEAESYRFSGGERIQVKFQPATIGEVTEQIVSDDGNIGLPTGTSLNVKGLTPSEAKKLIAEQMVKDTNAKTVQASILILEYPPRKIYVAGQVRTPKSIVLTPGVPMSLLGALQEAGGVSEQGDPTRVNVVRTDADGKRSGHSYDTTLLAQPGSADLGPRLQAGDTIVVPHCDHFVFTGEFNRTGVISIGDLRLEPGEKPALSRVLAGLGGLKKEADAKKLKILHLKADGSRDVLTPFENPASLQDPVLHNADIVEVPARALEKETLKTSSVSVVGKVRTPGTYPIGDNGLKLSKAIMLAGGLLDTAKGSRVTVNRASEPGSLRVVDVRAILKEGRWELDVELMDGDIINVPERAF